MNWQKTIFGVFVVLFLGVTAWSASFFLEMNRSLTILRTQERANEKRLADAQAELSKQRDYLNRLQNDPALVESVIRKKLGYIREKEVVFRFEDDKRK